MDIEHHEVMVFTGLFPFVGNDASDEVGVGRVEVHHETLQRFLKIYLKELQKTRKKSRNQTVQHEIHSLHSIKTRAF